MIRGSPLVLQTIPDPHHQDCKPYLIATDVTNGTIIRASYAQEANNGKGRPLAIKFANIGPIEVSIVVTSIDDRPVDQSLEKMKFLVAVVPEFSPGITIIVVGAIFGMIIVVRRMK